MNRLSTREREILDLVLQGSSSRQIADRLGLSVRTVDNHRSTIHRKLNTHSIAGIVFAMKSEAATVA